MKFSGIIGFVTLKETKPSVWTEEVEERRYTGDVLKSIKRFETTSEKLQDNVNISNQISIVCDAYASEHLGDIRYVIYRNSKWKVTSIEEKYPRLTISLGGVYNGESYGTQST